MTNSQVAAASTEDFSARSTVASVLKRNVPNNDAPISCYECGAEVINMLELPDVDLKCPKCGWQPVVVVARELPLE